MLREFNFEKQETSPFPFPLVASLARRQQIPADSVLLIIKLGPLSASMGVNNEQEFLLFAHMVRTNVLSRLVLLKCEVHRLLSTTVELTSILFIILFRQLAEATRRVVYCRRLLSDRNSSTGRAKTTHRRMSHY